jgi:hypothetical protein
MVTLEASSLAAWSLDPATRRYENPAAIKATAAKPSVR